MTKALTTPEGFVCPACRYDMSVTENWKCPECGRSFTFEDGEAFTARRHCRTRVLRLLLWQLGLGSFTCIVAAALWTISIGDAFNGIATGAVCGMILLSSMFVGLFIAWRSRRPERAGWAAAWLESHVWLQAPWIGVVLLAACVKSGAFALTLTIGLSAVQGLTEGMVFVGAFLCLAAPAVGLGLWFKTYRAARRQYMLTDRMAITYFPLLAFFVFLAALYWGFAAGISMFHIDLIPAQQ